MKKSKPISRAALAALCILFVVGMLAILILHAKLEEREKEQQLQTPTPAVTETGRPQATAVPADDPTITYEDATDLHNLDAHGSYDNSRRLFCELGYGIRLYLGAETSDEIEGLCLNPTLIYDYALNVDEQYIFLIRCSRGALENSGDPSPASSAQNSAFTSLLINSRTYDKLTPATYVNPDAFGVKWVNDITGDSWDKTGAVLYIHAIRLKDGHLMGTAKAIIDYDAGNEFYYLDSVSKSDVLTQKDISSAERTELINAAVGFFNAGNGPVALTITDNDRSNLGDFYVVESRPRPLYNKLFSAKGDVIPAGRLAGCDLVAVHIPYTGLGYITAYFTSADDATGLARCEFENTEYVLVAYDAINSPPFDAKSFNSFLVPEDAEKFKVN